LGLACASCRRLSRISSRYYPQTAIKCSHYFRNTSGREWMELVIPHESSSRGSRNSHKNRRSFFKELVTLIFSQGRLPTHPPTASVHSSQTFKSKANPFFSLTITTTMMRIFLLMTTLCCLAPAARARQIRGSSRVSSTESVPVQRRGRERGLHPDDSIPPSPSTAGGTTPTSPTSDSFAQCEKIPACAALGLTGGTT
jgi:hypothetical protein